MPLRASHRTANIALAGTTSQAIPLEGRQVAGLQTSSNIEGTAITFLASPTFGGTYTPLYDDDGVLVSAAVGTSRFVGMTGAKADAVSTAPFLKLVSNAAGGENAAQEIIVVLK